MSTIARKIVAESVARNPDMDEDEMTLCFDRAGFFEVLGYKAPGVDIRSQKAVADSEKKPDRFCLDDLGNAIFAFESKKPNDELVDYLVCKAITPYKDLLNQMILFMSEKAYREKEEIVEKLVRALGEEAA